MRRFFNVLLRLILLLVVVVALLTTVLAYRGSWFRNVQPAFAGDCKSLPLPGSAEDIQPDRERGIVYLSVMDRQSLVGEGDVQGTVLQVDLSRATLNTEPALANQPDHFRPHGLSLYIDNQGQRYLFAINHPVHRGSEPERVELFRQNESGTFEHIDTFTDPEFLSPNDLVAVGPRQFYIANDKSGDGFAAIGQLFGIGASPLTYFDNGKTRTVLNDIASGSGINVSADGNTLYVAETMAQRIRVLKREPVTGNVSDVRRIPIRPSPDNIDITPDGSLWIGAHPNTLKLIRHFIAGQPAPSQVLRVRLEGNSVEQENIFLDDGKILSASSVGVSFGKLLLIGSITQPALLICTSDNIQAD
jgi:arylesterase / paraoxonase